VCRGFRLRAGFDAYFQAEEVAPRAFRFTVTADTPGSEYGILPPGTAGVGSLGKVYTFAISE